jgi:hypothetical protein
LWSRPASFVLRTGSRLVGLAGVRPTTRGSSGVLLFVVDEALPVSEAEERRTRVRCGTGMVDYWLGWRVRCWLVATLGLVCFWPFGQVMSRVTFGSRPRPMWIGVWLLLA